MNINIKYTNLESTAAIEKYIMEKIEPLEKFIKRLDEKTVAQVQVELARTTKHHNKGPIFRAECNIELPGRLLRAQHQDWDVRRCIDEIKQELQKELKKYITKARPQDSSGQKKLRKLRGKP